MYNSSHVALQTAKYGHLKKRRKKMLKTAVPFHHKFYIQLALPISTEIMDGLMFKVSKQP